MLEISRKPWDNLSGKAALKRSGGRQLDALEMIECANEMSVNDYGTHMLEQPLLYYDESIET